MSIIPNGQKIFTAAPEVNTNYGGPASLQALNAWYTMEDISNTVRPYKVYTALVSQNSGSAPEVNVVLQDTINETFTFTYINQGSYQISSPIFNPENFLKISITLSQSVEQRVVSIQSNTLESGYVSISCQGLPVGVADDGIYFATLEIRVYN
jgi:hypothetical protein